MERFFAYARVLATAVPPAPAPTITVYNAGTLNLSSIFSDNGVTPKANPFTAGTDGFLFFYAANGRYDVKVSGGGVATPYTWSDILLLDSAAGFVNSINGDTTSAQTLTVGTAGADFAIVDGGGGAHTFNLPNASATARGVVSTGAQTFAGAKTFSTPIAAGSGGTGINASAAANGRLLIGNGAGFTLANLAAGANAGVTIANGAGSITLSSVQDIRTTASPVFNAVQVTAAADALLFSGYIPTLLDTGGVLSILAAGGTTFNTLTDGQVLIGQSGGAPAAATLTAGTAITITNGPQSITVTNSGVTSLACGGLTAKTGALSLTLTTTATAAPTWTAFGGGFALNIPPAAPGTTFGLVTDSAQTLGGQKTFAAHPIVYAGSSAGKQDSYAVVAPAPAIGVGNVGAGEDTLATFTLAASTMDTDDVSAVEIHAWCYCAANANTKTIKLYFGSTVLVTVANATLLNDAPVKLEALVLRKTATTQQAIGEGRSKAAGAAAGVFTVTAQSVTAPGETLANDVTIKVTGEAVANDDILCRALVVKVLTA